MADALANTLNADCVVFCPAFPGAMRTVYQGHLFVEDALLSESGMKDYPLTPMKDPDLRRWLSLQTNERVGHVAANDVFAGAAAIATALDRERGKGRRFVIVDALRDADLMEIGCAVRDLPLVTGGSGIAMGLPANFGCTPGVVDWAGQPGRAIAFSGSCSVATRGQVAHHAARHPSREIVAAEVIKEAVTAESLIDWAACQDGLPLIYSSADPEVIRAVQAEFGREASAAAIEGFFARLAQCAEKKGFTRIVAAGGETSGAVVEGLGLSVLSVGPEIDPGVPAVRANDTLVLALKSGNFGAVDIFEKANKVLAG